MFQTRNIRLKYAVHSIELPLFTFSMRVYSLMYLLSYIHLVYILERCRTSMYSLYTKYARNTPQAHIHTCASAGALVRSVRMNSLTNRRQTTQTDRPNRIHTARSGTTQHITHSSVAFAYNQRAWPPKIAAHEKQRTRNSTARSSSTHQTPLYIHTHIHTQQTGALAALETTYTAAVLQLPANSQRNTQKIRLKITVTTGYRSLVDR